LSAFDLGHVLDVRRPVEVEVQRAMNDDEREVTARRTAGG
jgi:hypothetical protein